MRITSLVVRNLRRHRRSFAFSVVGIILGVSSFVVFLALGRGLRSNVLERVYVVDQVEVVPPRTEMGSVGFSGSLFNRGTGLDDFTVQDLQAIPGVASVFPKMQLSFPSLAYGGEDLFGRNLATELIAEGISADLVAAELPAPANPMLAFRDWDTDRDGQPITCDHPGEEGIGTQVGCPAGRRCDQNGECQRLACDPSDEVLTADSESAANEARDYLTDRFQPRRLHASRREVAEHAVPEGQEAEFRVAVAQSFVDQARRILRRDFLPHWRARQHTDWAVYRARLRVAQRADEAERERREEDAAETGASEPAAIERLRRPPPLRDAAIIPPESRPCTDTPSYCTVDTRHCEMPIPVVTSPFLMELYNTTVQNVLSGSTRSLPSFTAQALIGFTFYGRLGRGYLGEAALLSQVGAAERTFRLVGWSPRAMRLGLTIPLSYVRRFNARYKGEQAEREYHSILVVAESSERLAGIVEIVEAPPPRGLGLAIGPDYQQAKRGGLLITLLTVGLLFISGLIIMLASLNITHTFLMVVAERRREIGVLRAVGARRLSIQFLVLAEAVVIGVTGALFGVLLAWGGASVADGLLDCSVPAWDWLEAWCIPDFPFKPKSFFAFEPWIVGAGFAMAVLFSLIGAFVPAYRASRVDPADALRAH